MPRQDSPRAAAQDVNRTFIFRDDTRREARSGASGGGGAFAAVPLVGGSGAQGLSFGISGPAGGSSSSPGIDKLGGLHQAIVAIVDRENRLGVGESECVGILEPDNWRRDDLRQSSRVRVDVRHAVQLIADRDNEFGGAGAGEIEESTPGRVADAPDGDAGGADPVDPQTGRALPTDAPTGTFDAGGGNFVAPGPIPGTFQSVNPQTGQLGSTIFFARPKFADPAGAGSTQIGAITTFGGGETVARDRSGVAAETQVDDPAPAGTVQRGGLTVGRGGGATAARGRCDTRPGFFDPENRSTRLVDQFPDVKGGGDGERGEALLVSAITVVDDAPGLYSAATNIAQSIRAGGGGIPGPGFDDPVTNKSELVTGVDQASGGARSGTAGGGGQLAGGYNFDSQRAGVWWSVFRNNPLDRIATGRRGTEICLTGIRHDSHFEWNEQHGRIHFRLLDCSSCPESLGMKVKGAMEFDTTVANAYSKLGHESVQWRPVISIQQFAPPTTKLNGGTRIPIPGGGSGKPEDGGLGEDTTSDGDGSTSGEDGTGRTAGPAHAPEKKIRFPGWTPTPHDERGWRVYVRPRTGTAISNGNDLDNDEYQVYATALRVQAAQADPPTGSANFLVAGGCPGDFQVVSHAGPGGDRALPFIYQGDGTSTPVAGFNVPGYGGASRINSTWIGVDGADSPTIYWGNASQSPNYGVGIDSVSGNLQACVFDAAGDPDTVTTQQLLVKISGIHHQGPKTGDNSWSLNANDKADSGGFGQVPVQTTTTTPGDAEPGASFARKLWFEEDGTGAADPIYIFIYNSATAGPMGIRLDPDPNAPTLTPQAPASVPTPPTGDEALFLDSANSNHLSRKDSADVVVDIEGGGGAFDIDGLGSGTPVATDPIAFADLDDTGTEKKTTFENALSQPTIQAAVVGSFLGGEGNPEAEVPASPQSTFAFFTGEAVDASVFTYRYFRVTGSAVRETYSIPGTRYVCSVAGSLVAFSFVGASDGQQVELLKNGSVAATVTMPLAAAYATAVPVKTRDLTTFAVTVVADDVLELRLKAGETGAVSGSFAMQIRHSDAAEGGNIFTFSRTSSGVVLCNETGGSFLHLPARMKLLTAGWTITNPASKVFMPILAGSTYSTVYGNAVGLMALATTTDAVDLDPPAELEKGSLVTLGRAGPADDPGAGIFSLGMIAA